MTYDKIVKELHSIKNNSKVKILQRFFKTKKGEYGYGDVFLGITVPLQRKIAKKYFNETNLIDLKKLLQTKIHEYRFTALEILVMKYEHTSDKKTRSNIFNFYLNNINKINNWDLVDTSAPYIVGDYLFKHPNKQYILIDLVNSKNVWRKRIGIVSTFTFIKNGNYSTTQKLAQILLNDNHDLIHKATGWMLREIGKRSQSDLINFLAKFSDQMPRTMYRYAVERLKLNLTY